MYENMDKFIEAVELLKAKYMESGPQFSGRSEIFSEVAQSLIHKAADFMTISSRKESDMSLKKIKEKCEELEKERIEKKNEY